VVLGGGATPDDVLFWVRPELRLALDADDALSVVAGAGLWAEGALAAHGALGLDFDVPSRTRTGLRFHTRYLVSTGDPTFRVELGVGMRIGRRIDVPVVPEPEPIPVPVEPEPVMTQVPDFPVNSALVWVPTPVCSWLPPEEANDAMLTLPSLPPSMAAVGVYGPAVSPAAAVGDPSAAPVRVEPPAAPTQGDIVFALNPGDVVEVDGERVDAANGIATIRRDDGEVQVRITGGGRVIETPIGVSAGRSIWLSVPGAEPLRVTFPSGSSVLSDQGRERVLAIATAAGESRFSIEGSFSAGGSEQLNRRLARERSQAVLDILFANGLDESRVDILPPQPPDDGLEPAEQRAAVLRVLGDDS
jgi:outer membrane protein OmpA-like peptidoglycan-associated protein